MDLLISGLVLSGKLGLPVAIGAWLLFTRLYLTGQASPAESEEAVNERIRKADKETKWYAKKPYWQSKWMEFGGGFYGLAALWTLIILELQELWWLLGNMEVIDKIFSQSIVSTFVELIINQINNFVAAITWFLYWTDGGQEIGLSFLVTYGGYMLGMQAARLTYVRLGVSD